MNQTLLHYRSWQGQFHGPVWSVWPIARVALGSLLSRRLFWVLYAFALLLFMMFFFGTYLLDWVESRLPPNPIRVGQITTDPERVMRLIRQAMQVLNGSQETFAIFFVYQGTMVMIVLALAGSILVGQDLNHGSIPFYLAKPINRWHYLGGKFLATGIVVHMLTTLPALILYGQHALEDWEYLTNVNYFIEHSLGRGPASWPLLLGVLGYGMILAVVLSIVLVTLASVLKNTMPLVMVWTALFLFLPLVSRRMVDSLGLSPRWRLLDLWNDLSLLGRGCLGIAHSRIDPQPQPSFLEAGLVLAGVCSLCLIYLNHRTKAVEVIR